MISVRGTMISLTVISAACEVAPMIVSGLPLPPESPLRAARASRSTSSEDSDSSGFRPPVIRRTVGSMTRSKMLCIGRSI